MNYGKRPLWQWILIYVVIGGIIYAAVYFFVLKKNYSGTGGTGGSAPSTQTAPGY
ncbi:MAG TPA: hypothetical protein VFA93_01205 [Patescibacteria group bacterium]|nr:hypothetical protein [Patescibacteria group bacterium]